MKHLAILLLLLCLTGCGAEESTVQPDPEPVAEAQPTLVETVPETIPTEPKDPVIELLKELTLEEKVGQLFFQLTSSHEEEHLKELMKHIGYEVVVSRGDSRNI